MLVFLNKDSLPGPAHRKYREIAPYIKDNSKAFLNALECDSVSAFGGIVSFNSNVVSETAIHIKDIFLECVVAPSFDEEALEILKIKKNLRILKFSKNQLPQKNQNSTKSIMGGLLVQDTDVSEEKTENWISVTNKNPSLSLIHI